jgi:ATP-dependent DNA ligase
VWAYVDETGNTGNRIFDDEQPFFTTAAMMTKSNFDLVYQAEISRIARRVRPELVAEITYLTRTDDGLLRHVVFQGLREDKPAGEVRRDWRPAR